MALINLALGACASIRFTAWILLPLLGAAVIETVLFQYLTGGASWLSGLWQAAILIASISLGYGCGVGLAAFRLRSRRAGKPSTAPASKGR
jgi:hypothetical protein